MSVIIVAIVVVVLFILGSIAFRLYLNACCGHCDSKASMDGKTIIITGANCGIGKETAMDLAKRGAARVILACRNMETAKLAKDEIIEATGNENIVVKKLDLSSQKSIRDFAEDILKNEKQLDVLIHNAGCGETFKKVVSVDGIENTLATNHYGPFLLTHLLIDLLKKSAPSRIVVVSSEWYRLATVNLNNLNPINHSFPAYLYYVSKGMNIMFTLELARRLKNTGITANCLHPGVIDTGIWRNVNFPLSLGLNFMKLFFKTPPEGAQTTIYLAVSEEVDGITGKYFMDCKKADLQEYILDEAKAKKLWEFSTKIVHLRDSDPQI